MTALNYERLTATKEKHHLFFIRQLSGVSDSPGPNFIFLEINAPSPQSALQEKKKRAKHTKNWNGARERGSTRRGRAGVKLGIKVEEIRERLKWRERGGRVIK